MRRIPLYIYRTVEGEGDVPQSYVHTQASANTTWLIQHNLGFKPQPYVINSSNEQVIGFDVTWPSDNAIVLTFKNATAGTAYVS